MSSSERRPEAAAEARAGRLVSFLHRLELVSTVKMGVPKFYRWISERYPCLSEVVKEHQVGELRPRRKKAGPRASLRCGTPAFQLPVVLVSRRTGGREGGPRLGGLQVSAPDRGRSHQNGLPQVCGPPWESPPGLRKEPLVGRLLMNPLCPPGNWTWRFALGCEAVWDVFSGPSSQAKQQTVYKQ